MATTIDIDRTGVSEPSAKPAGPRRHRGLEALAAVAIAAVIAAAIFVTWPQPDRAPRRAANTLYTSGELTTMRLAHAGLVPAATLRGGRYLLKRLVNEGLIPRETLDEYQPPADPLYTPRELKIIALVNAGLLPKETLDGEPFRTKQLINEGVIPRAAARPAPAAGR